MKKPLDRITEAYYNKMGTTFGKKVRNRIHWVCEQAKGDKILDVGCSQGIVPILLGREGKTVLGLDLLQDSIDFAKNELSNESEITQKYVDFKMANFLDYDFGADKYQTIIIGEVLEHITDPERFLRKASNLLGEDGTIIITVPFGINDYFDHKKTYYTLDLLELVNGDLYIQEIEFFGKWIGVIVRNCKEVKEKVVLDKDLVKRIEEAFYQVERQLVDDVSAKNNTLEKNKDIIANLNQKIQGLEDRTLQLKSERDQLQTKLLVIEEKLDHSNYEKNLSNTEILRFKEKVTLLNREIEFSDNEVADLKGTIQALQFTISEKESLLENLNAKNEELNLINLTTISEKNDQLNKSKELEGMIKKLKTNLKDSIESFEKYKTNSSQVSEHLQIQITNFERIVAEKTVELESITNLLANEQTKLIALTKKFADKENQLEKLSLKFGQREQRINHLEKNHVNKVNEEVNYKEIEYIKEIKSLKEQLIGARKENVTVKEELVQSYSKEERLLKAYRQLLKKYEAISQSKLGKITLSYWTWRRSSEGRNK